MRLDRGPMKIGRGVIWFDEIDWMEGKTRMVSIRGGIASSLRQVLDSKME